MTTASDRDWTWPDDDAPASADPAVRLVGVLRCDAQGERPVPFATLLEATCEPPLSPEAEVRGQGGCLAQCAEDVACWVFTMLGKQQIDREIRGQVAA